MTSFPLYLLRQGVIVKESRGRLVLPHAGQDESPLLPESWEMILTRAAVLALFGRRTPTEPPNRPHPYPNTIPLKQTAQSEEKRRKSPRQATPCREWLTVRRSEPREKVSAMTVGRLSTISKQMAATVAAYGAIRLYFPDELDAALVSANADLQQQHRQS